MCSKRQFVQKFPTKSTLTDLDGLQTNLNGPYDWGLSGVAFNRISIFERIKRKWTQSRLSWTKLRSVSKIWYFPEFIAWVSSKTDFDEGRFRLLDSHRSNWKWTFVGQPNLRTAHVKPLLWVIRNWPWNNFETNDSRKNSWIHFVKFWNSLEKFNTRFFQQFQKYPKKMIPIFCKLDFCHGSEMVLLVSFFTFIENAWANP